MAKGEDTRDHPGRRVHRERFKGQEPNVVSKFNPQVSTSDYEAGATLPGTRRNTSGRVVTKRESTGWS